MFGAVAVSMPRLAVVRVFGFELLNASSFVLLGMLVKMGPPTNYFKTVPLHGADSALTVAAGADGTERGIGRI